MSIEKLAFKGASWLGIFNFISQIISWSTTILIARILVPGDYGLMEMSTIITGYAALFSELGLGASIIQRPKISQNDLSSIFWFSTIVSFLLAIGCFLVATPTSYLFHEPRVIPLTRSVSLIFILTGLQIIPISLLKKEIMFKTIGKIEMVTTFLACLAMYLIAISGGGVWTLMGGMIFRQLVRVIMLYGSVKWLPSFHFNLYEVKSFIRFGIFVALSGTLFYFRGTADKLFAGRAWSATDLGYYTFALSLAAIPTDKIATIINQVSFPIFAKLQDDEVRTKKYYLNTIKITATIVFPIFIGGFLVGEDLVKVLLDNKWLNIITIFKYLCLAQIITSLNAINNFVHIAQGRPHWDFFFNLGSSVFMPISFFIAVRYGLNAILIPWFTTYLLICTLWIVITLNKIGIDIIQYLSYLSKPFCAVLIMSIGIILFQTLVKITDYNIGFLIMMISKISVGSFFYLSFLWMCDKDMIMSIKQMIR